MRTDQRRTTPPDYRESPVSRGDSAIFGGLIAISVFLLPNLLRQPVTDETQVRAIAAFAFAIPLLGVSAFIETVRAWPSTEDSWLINATEIVAVLAAAGALALAFTYFVPEAGIAFAAGGIVAAITGVHVIMRVPDAPLADHSADD